MGRKTKKVRNASIFWDVSPDMIQRVKKFFVRSVRKRHSRKCDVVSTSPTCYHCGKFGDFARNCFVHDRGCDHCGNNTYISVICPMATERQKNKIWTKSVSPEVEKKNDEGKVNSIRYFYLKLTPDTSAIWFWVQHFLLYQFLFLLDWRVEEVGNHAYMFELPP